MNNRISICLAVVLTALSAISLRADDGSALQDGSASALKISQTSYANANTLKKERLATDRPAPLTLSPSFDESSAFSGELSSLRLDLEFSRFPSDRNSSSSAFYIKIREAYFILSALHGIKERGKSPSRIEMLSLVAANGERFAFDDGRGSEARRRDLERRGMVSKATSYVDLAGRPYLLIDEDVVVFKLAKPLPGFVPLIPGDYKKLEVKDSLTALTANGSSIGATRSCRVAELNFANADHRSRLRFVSNLNDENSLFRLGDSGCALLNREEQVVAVLLQIKDIGMYNGNGALLSNDALAVSMNEVVALISSHWGL